MTRYYLFCVRSACKIEETPGRRWNHDVVNINGVKRKQDGRILFRGTGVTRVLSHTSARASEKYVFIAYDVSVNIIRLGSKLVNAMQIHGMIISREVPK